MQIPRELLFPAFGRRPVEHAIALRQALENVLALAIQNPDSLSDDQISVTWSQRFAFLLDWISRNPPAQKELAEKIFALFSDSGITRQERADLFRQILRMTDLSENSAWAESLLHTLSKTFPGIQLAPLNEQHLSALVRQSLNLLTTNDFAHWAPLIPQILDSLPSSPAPIPVSTAQNTPQTQKRIELAPTPLSAQTMTQLIRLLNPLREMESLGIPPQLNLRTVTQLRQKIESVLSLPLPLHQAFRVPPGTYPARISEVGPDFMRLEIPGQAPARVLLSPGWQGMIRADTTIAITFIDPETSSAQTAMDDHPPTPENISATDLSTPSASLVAQDAPARSHSPARPITVLPHPEAAWIPPEQIPDWIERGIPFTAKLAEISAFLRDYADLPDTPDIVLAGARILHNLEIALPPGQSLQEEHQDLALRWWLATRSEQIPQGLPLYQPETDPEPELFRRLSPRAQTLLARPQGASTLIRPEELARVIRSALQQLTDSPEPDPLPQPLRATATSEIDSDRETLRSLQRQLTWTQVDQETRHPDERQQIFYWFHQGELHKARVQIRERSREHRQEHASAERHFCVETRTPRLGTVRVDCFARQDRIRVFFKDSSGKARQATEEERPQLAQELAQIGWHLEELVYQALKAHTTTASAEPPTAPGSSFLDLRA